MAVYNTYRCSLSIKLQQLLRPEILCVMFTLCALGLEFAGYRGYIGSRTETC